MERVVQKLKFPPRQPKLKRVAAYARVSSGKDVMLHSLAVQVEYYSNYIRRHPGWEYVGVYSDEAKTGTKDSREQFQQLLTDCKAGKIDHIITKSISRMARNTVTLLETVQELKAMDITVYFEEQNIDTGTDDGELMLSILASYAQEASLSASENQKWRVRQNFENGQPWRGFMLGYRYKDGQYIVVPEEAEIVRSIYADFLDGKGVTVIMKRLNKEGILTQQGFIWHKSAVTRVLKNYTYTGNLLLQTKFRENHLTKRTLVNHGQLPQYHATDTHEAIIDIGTYNSVQLEITIISSLAQEESRSISENVTWSQRKRFADGKVSMAYKHPGLPQGTRRSAGDRSGAGRDRPENLPAVHVRQNHRLHLQAAGIGGHPHSQRKNPVAVADHQQHSHQ